MAMLFDSHAHYNDEKFTDAKATLESLFAGNIKYILNAGTNIETSGECIALADEFEGMYAAVGIHPHDSEDVTDSDAAEAEIRRMLSHPKAVALGEIGLDYHYDFSPRDVQQYWFERQMCIAEELGVPVIIHDREAHGDCMDVIKKHPGVCGVMHSFSGSCEMAAELVRMGWYISFTGVITFKNASRIIEAVKSIPDDRIMIETDCPYLTPEPYRGRVNHSGYMIYTAEKMAQIRGVSVDRICEQTLDNACRFFGISQ